MNRKLCLKFFFTLTVLIVSFSPFLSKSPVYAATIEPDKPLATTVSHYIEISVVLIGFDQDFIDIDYLKANLEYEIHPILQVYEINHGSVYNLVYDVTMADSSFTDDLKDFLMSVAQIQSVPEFLNSNNDTNLYAAIDAASTENWLNEHADEFGGIPSNGYTLLIANMSSVSNYYHYYSIEYYDLDEYSEKAKYYDTGISFPVVNWMFSWGGHYNFYYIDLSAGDPEYDYSLIEHIPMQCLESKNYTV
ncbi:MAG: hypothetical protein OEZ25_02330, partial [Candidatus Bathyarchaeota archaeon]|nr:hypothetical protein [Candidatus Bathyarchaeota archaeon]